MLIGMEPVDNYSKQIKKKKKKKNTGLIVKKKAW